MWLFSLVVVGILATGIVFAANAGLRQAGLRGFAGAAGAESSRLEYMDDGGMCGGGVESGCVGLGRPVSLPLGSSPSMRSMSNT